MRIQRDNVSEACYKLWRQHKCPSLQGQFRVWSPSHTPLLLADYPHYCQFNLSHVMSTSGQPLTPWYGWQKRSSRAFKMPSHSMWNLEFFVTILSSIFCLVNLLLFSSQEHWKCHFPLSLVLHICASCLLKVSSMKVGTMLVFLIIVASL